MATFYVGVRPVLRGRKSGEFLNPTVKWNGTTRGAGTYSFYNNYGPGLLSGFPDNNHTPGSGRSPHDLNMSRVYNGVVTQVAKNSLKSPGGGARLTGFRFHPNEYKGTTAGKVFAAGYGHASYRNLSYSQYDNFTFDGVTSAVVLNSPGHASRFVSQGGAANSFGAFAPLAWKGAGSSALTAPGHTGVTYAHNKVNEWKGVASAKAL